MSQSLILKNTGLQTNSNQLSEVPQGALTFATNIVIDKDGVAEPRRGYQRQASPPSDAATRTDRLTNYQDKIIARRSNDDSLAYYDAGWTAYSGTYLHPDDDQARMNFAQANGNLYFTTSVGIKALDVYTGPVYSAGMPKGLDGVASTTGGSGMMSENCQLAYRVVWGSRDTNNNLYLGAPSQRILVANPVGSTKDVSLTITIPSEITTDDFFQVYRSKESADVNTEANDELQLVYEANPSGAEITAKSITYTDSVPVSLMGAALYTNSSQEGISEANDRPPFAKDIYAFKNYLFFGNIKTKHFLDIKLLAVSGSGLVNDDTIVINGVTFTGKTAGETIASGYFKIFTAGSAAQNIDDTARSLVKVINQYTSNTTIYAYYESGYEDLPGQIMLEKRTLDDTSFAVTVSRAVAWDIGTGTSSNDEYQNGLMWSKIDQPEHVPSSHLQLVGSKNYPIKRIIALRESLFIMKGDGVFKLTGSGGSWSIEPMDTSTRIIAPDSAAVVNNQVFCLSDQGIVAVSDVGVQVISRPIENQIQELISDDYEKLKNISFGVAYDTDRKYILHTIASQADNYCTIAFVYNTFTQAWTKWEKDAQHAFVNPTDDRIYLANPEDKYILKERKDLVFTDYADEEVDGYSILAKSDYTLTLNSIVGLNVGDIIYESSSFYSVITAIDGATTSVTVYDLYDWAIASVTVLKGIRCVIEYTGQHFENPGVMKHFQEVAFLFREANFIDGVASFYTDLSGGYSLTTINGNFGAGLWGRFNWGEIPWGGTDRPKPIRVFIPRDKSRGSLLAVKLTIQNAFSKWSINGVSLQYEWVSERVSML